MNHCLILLFSVACLIVGTVSCSLVTLSVVDPVTLSHIRPGSSSPVRATVFPANSTVINHCAHGLRLAFNVTDVDAGFAAAVYDDTMNDNGWAVLHVETRPITGEGSSASTFEEDWCRAYAAGVAEAAITATRIMQTLVAGLYAEFGNSSFLNPATRPTALVQFLERHDDWVRGNIRIPSFVSGHRRRSSSIPADHHADPRSRRPRTVLDRNVWNRMSLIVAQNDGLLDGFNLVAPYLGLAKLDRLDFHLLSSYADIGDILVHLYPDTLPDWHRMSPKALRRYTLEHDHCSALISMTDDFSEVFFAHSTWSSYNGMYRVYKHYALSSLSDWAGDASDDARVLRLKYSFSSYPGYLSSTDDFYLLLHSNMSVMETTIFSYNDSLRASVHPESLFSWHRILLGNSLARSGAEWAAYFSAHPSGTYTNQYMVFDLKQFTPSRPLRDNALWIVEEIPTLIVAGDQTATLARGYWPSYNRPFFPEIYRMADYPRVVAEQGTGYSYELAARAKIFRRDAYEARSASGMEKIMRSNNFKSDPFSEGDPGLAICSRGDLDSEDPSASGCLDTKYSSASMFREGVSFALSGPTTNGGSLPPFSWTQFPDIYHEGLPEVYDFPFVRMQWKPVTAV